MTQGDHEVELGPGDYLAWDPSIPHDVENVGDGEGRILVIYLAMPAAATGRGGSGAVEVVSPAGPGSFRSVAVAVIVFGIAWHPRAGRRLPPGRDRCRRLDARLRRAAFRCFEAIEMPGSRRRS
jgi:hypothetical protein